ESSAVRTLQRAFPSRRSSDLSGVSARMGITALENRMSTAERRALLTGEDRTTVRLVDFMGVIPSITGKIELVYEGEQEGADYVRSEEHTSELQSRENLVCRLL